MARPPWSTSTRTPIRSRFGDRYYRLRQMDTDGSVHYSDPLKVDLATGVDEATTPTAYELSQNHPNPFNPVTTIEFAVPQEETVTLTVFTPLGQVVSTLVNERKAAGRYTVKVDGSNWSSGVYLYRLQAGQFVATRKLVLTR